MIWAEFVWLVGVLTVAMINNVGFAPLATVPTVHTPVALSYAPCEGVADTKVMPAGNVSVTETLVAESGPALLTVTVNVTLSPMSGAALLTVVALVFAALLTILALLLAMTPFAVFLAIPVLAVYGLVKLFQRTSAHTV